MFLQAKLMFLCRAWAISGNSICVRDCALPARAVSATPIVPSISRSFSSEDASQQPWWKVFIIGEIDLGLSGRSVAVRVTRRRGTIMVVNAGGARPSSYPSPRSLRQRLHSCRIAYFTVSGGELPRSWIKRPNGTAPFRL